MQRKSLASVWRVNLATGERQCLARSLAYPNGIVSDGNRIVFSESWKHRLSSIASSGGAVTPVLQHLPAYPCRIMPAFDGYLLALFAPLNRQQAKRRQRHSRHRFRRGSTMMQPVIEMRNVTKSYRGVPAVKNVDFTLAKGETHALLGENGAGKSTLTKLIAGVVEASSGEMKHLGRAVSYASPFEALSNGIAMVFQEASLVPSMTVAQNIYLGEEKFLNRLRGIYIAAQQFLQPLNFTVDPTATVASLGAAKRQMVEIARAVHHKASVIIFD